MGQPAGIGLGYERHGRTNIPDRYGRGGGGCCRCAGAIQHPVPAVVPVAQPPAVAKVTPPEPADFEPADALDRRDAYAVTALGDVIDRAQHAAIARLTMGLSPTALTEAYLDWAIHLASQPGKRLQLIDKALRKSTPSGTIRQWRCAQG